MSGDGDASSTTGALEVVATSGPDTTEPLVSSSTTAGPGTTEVAPTTDVEATDESAVGRFEPACVDQVRERSTEQQADDPALDHLSVVGDRPALEIELPAAVTSDDPAVPPIAGAVRVPAGLLVTVAAPSSGWFPGGIVALVDLDGHLRWVRCFDDRVEGPIVASLSSGPDRALIGTSVWDDAATASVYSWQIVSLADGTTLGTLDELVAEAGITAASAANRSPAAVGGDVVVFGPPGGHVLDAGVDGLLRLDLDTWTVTATTVPPEFDGHPAGELDLEIGRAGGLLRMGTPFGQGVRVPQFVEVDGAWVDDESRRRAEWGLTVGILWPGPAIAAWDATGVIRWTREMVLPMREGFVFGSSGDVTMAVSCGPAEPTSSCADERLVGLSSDTGDELWSLPGWRVVGPLGDRVAYVTDVRDPVSGLVPDRWMVLDLETGRIADTPSWSGATTFLTECCGGSDYQHTDALGGMIVAVSNRTMSVWFPAALTPSATVTVELLST